MIGDVLVLRAVEHALASNQPIQEPLHSAAEAFPARRAVFQLAARAAAAGDLRGALHSLLPVGLDPLVLAVAHHDPGAAGVASARLVTVPRRRVLAVPFLVTLGYLLVIATVQVGVLAVLHAKVLGVLLGLSPNAVAMLISDLIPPLLWLWKYLFLAILLLFGMRRRWVLPGVRRSLERMKLCLVAAELTRTRPQAAQALVAAHDPTLAGALAWSPEALEAAARAFELEAHRRAARATVIAKTVGGGVLALLALMAMGALYLTLPGLGVAVA